MKNLRELESCPKFSLALCPAPRVMAGTNPSIGPTLSNAISLPDLNGYRCCVMRMFNRHVCQDFRKTELTDQVAALR